MIQKALTRQLSSDQLLIVRHTETKQAKMMSGVTKRTKKENPTYVTYII